MKIAIIGAGFTGLAAGVRLVDHGHKVKIFEANKKVGGFARGFKSKTWDYQLEEYYHHIFASDQEIINLANKVKLEPKFYQPETDCFINGQYQRLDSPISVLKFSPLSLAAKLRMGLGLMMLKLIPNGQFLENYTLVEKLPEIIGGESYEKIWQRLMLAKFGPYMNKVNLAWFWARVVKRSKALGYFDGGFQQLAEKTAQYINYHGGEIIPKTKVKNIKFLKNQQFSILDEKFDKVIITTPAPTAEKLINKKIINCSKIDYLWGQTIIFELSKSLLPVYWVNILEKDYPFLVAVEHTRMISQKHYGSRHIVYFGNYLDKNDFRLKASDKDLVKTFFPFLKKLNPNFQKSWLINYYRFQDPYAQPVFPINYSKDLPPIKTKINGLYLANMSMVYPWDRGTNYAVFLGNRVADIISS